jgi:signal transduction histidine kinase
MALKQNDARWALAIASVFLASSLPILAPRMPPDMVALLWLPNAVLAVAYLRRIDQWPSLALFSVVAILAGAFAGILGGGGEPDWASGLGWAALLVADCVEAGLLAFIVSRFGGTRFGFRVSRDASIWAAAAFVGSGLGFVVAQFADSLGFKSPIDTGPVASAAASWVLGDTNGHLTLGAFLVALTQPDGLRAARAIRSDAPGAALIGLALIVSGVLAFGGPSLWGGTDGQPSGHPGFIGLLVPAMVWAAFRYGPLGAAAAVALTLAPGMALTLNEIGQFGSLMHQRHLARELQILTLALAGATLLIGILGAEARAGRDAALAADGMKTRFLARLAHELRTPLNGVIGAADLLSREWQTATPAQQDRLDLVRSSARAMASMVEDLLEFATLARNGVPLRTVVFDPAQPFRDAVAIFAPRAKWERVDLHLTLTGFEDLSIRSDPARWRQIIFNLVSNAVESTREGRIDVIATAHALPKDGVVTFEIHVRDSGPGIAAEHQSEIFEPFVQGPGRERRGSLGLGLAVARETVEALGGAIGVQSQIGLGADFWVRLSAPRAMAAPPAALQAGRARALLAEDNATNRLVMTAMLASLGFDVVTVENGADAVGAASSGDFALIVMDIQMPVMDGEEATERIRAMKGGRGRTPIIAVTAHALPGDDVRFKAAGADAVLNKPIEQAALAAEVARALT